MGKLLTKKEAAEALRVSCRTLERHIESKMLVAYKIGRKTLIEQVELDKFIKRNRAS